MGQNNWRVYLYTVVFCAIIHHAISQPERYNNDNNNDNNNNDNKDVRPHNNWIPRLLADVATHWGHHAWTRHDAEIFPQTTAENRSKCLTVPDGVDFMTQKQSLHGGVALHVVIGVYVCVALGVLCDYYFVPSLEIICYHLNIQEDVGGATLMSIGSSAPDIFSGIIAILFVEGELGVGCAIGTTVFNLLFVVGVSGLVAYQSFKLAWWPLCRDMSSYCISIAVLALVSMDEYVTLVEAAIMVLLYVLYFTMLWFNRPIEKKIYFLLKDEKSMEQRFEDSVLKKSLLDNDTPGDKDVEEEKTSVSSSDIDNDYCGYPTDPPENFFHMPSDPSKVVTWLLLLPIKTIFFLTIPDLRRPKCQKLISFTFFGSMIWIGVLTYILLGMVNSIGHTFGLPGLIMGITLVTFGTSVPDLLCSVLVIRRGRPNMAISQCIASNPLGILIGMGLPWLLKIAILERRALFVGPDMLISCVQTLTLAVLAAFTLILSKLVLSKKIGAVFTGGYVFYVVGSVCYAVFVTCGLG